ncbi:hypothetical protein LJR016_004327 [Devosia sp. LjRoot16]|uniref:hypothetical protein n=1 Tax=Devosia sp. LjRoot16 TaxID=3342271 RepID=UPI003ECE4DC3
MADQKLSQLPAATDTVNAMFYGVQGGTPKKFAADLMGGGESVQWPEVLRSTNRVPRGSFIRGVDGWGANFSTDGAIAVFGFDPTSSPSSNLPAYFNRSKVQLGCNVTAKSASVGSPRRIAVDPTKKHKVTVAAMGYGSVDPLPSSIQVHCFNSSGQFISTLTVNINVVLAPTLPNGYYHATINELGGSAPAFPAGTVSALPQVGFVSTASQGLQVYMMAMIAEDELPCAIGTAIANSGGGTHEAASDGTHLYIISHGMNEIAKMDGDLKKVSTLTIGDYPHDIVVVGTNLWVCNHDAATLQRIALGSFTVSNTYAITGSKNGFGLGTDGTRLWLAAGTNAQGCALYEVNVSTGAMTLVSTDLNTGAANLPVRYLAGSLWTIHEGNSQVKRINPTGGATLATINCSIGEIYGLGSGNGYVFACGSDGVAVIDPATNTVVQTHRFRLLNRGMSNVEVSGRYAFACASNGAIIIDVALNQNRELLLEGGDCKWARALPSGRVVIGAYAAPWMFILG